MFVVSHVPAGYGGALREAIYGERAGGRYLGNSPFARVIAEITHERLEFMDHHPADVIRFEELHGGLPQARGRRIVVDLRRVGNALPAIAFVKLYCHANPRL